MNSPYSRYVLKKAAKVPHLAGTRQISVCKALTMLLQSWHDSGLIDNIAYPLRDSSRGLQGCTNCQMSVHYMTNAALGAKIGSLTLLFRLITQMAERPKGAGDQVGVISSFSTLDHLTVSLFLFFT